MKVIDEASKPKIGCIDLSHDIFKNLIDNNYNLYVGTLGDILKIPNKYSNDMEFILFDNDMSASLHELDILIIDLMNETHAKFNKLQDEEIKHSMVIKYVCKYPSTLFDPRPLSASILANKISEIDNRTFIKIVFAAQECKLDYTYVISPDHSQFYNTDPFSLYGFDPVLPIGQSKAGDEMIICDHIDENLTNLLKKHKPYSIYYQTFFHISKWDKENWFSNDSNRKIKYLPLLKNRNDEVVSFIQVNNNHVTFVFPDMLSTNKNELLEELLKNILPSMYPEVFPDSTQFKWIENTEYFIPNHQNLLNNKVELKKEYEKNDLAIDKSIDENNRKYKFLHDLITETDDKLVHAVCDFLNFLEFKNVIIKDEYSKSIKEEDIQVELEEGILVIEVKGIGGTSTDSNCSQVAKIKHRRWRERNSFDVWALYIVNHQRFLPPLSRKNPPFTKEQIDDAINDERGLLTTWQLFCLYNQIETGLITKEEARKQMLEYGLVIFKPKLSVALGSPKETYQKGYVGILHLNNTKIKVGESIILEKNNQFVQSQIITIQVDGKDVQEVSDGEVGIGLNSKIENGMTLWKQ